MRFKRIYVAVAVIICVIISLLLFLEWNDRPVNPVETTYARLGDQDGAVLLIAYDINCGVYFTPDLVSGQVKYTSRENNVFTLKTKHSPNDGKGPGLDLAIDMTPNTLIVIGQAGEQIYPLAPTLKFQELPVYSKDYMSSEDRIWSDISHITRFKNPDGEE